MIGSCAKQRVVAVITVRGRDDVIVGENLCLTPQSTCPRQPGEAYAKCITHCSQLGHAEETALRQIRMAGIDAGDVSSIRVYGHTGPCDNCHALLVAHGLRAVTTFHPEVRPATLTDGDKAQIALAYNLYAPSSHSKHADEVCVSRSQRTGCIAQGANGSTTQE